MKIFLSLLSVSTVFTIFQIIFPYKPSSELVYNRFYPNKNKYNSMELLALPLLLIWLALAGLTTSGLGILIREYLSAQSSYNYIIKPPISYFLLCGLVLGFGLIRVPLEFVFKRILKEEYPLYKEYTNFKHGFDGEKAWRPFEILLTSCGVVLLIWGLNWYVRIDDKNNIEINEVFSFETRKYPVIDISEIECSKSYFTRKGVKNEKKYFLIKMNDNYVWNSKVFRFFSSDADKEYLKNKIEELSKLTSIPIQYTTVDK